MEAQSGTLLLINMWDAGAPMEAENGSSCCGEHTETGTGTGTGRTLPDPLRDKRSRARRAVQFGAAAFLLLLVVVLIVVGVGRSCGTSPGGQTDPQPRGLSSGVKGKQLQGTSPAPSDHRGDLDLNPMAMLTAPKETSSDPKLQWEDSDGNAFCVGGFSYKNGSLVVPRNGYYRVFLQVTYEGIAEDCGNTGVVHLSTSVLYRHDSYNQDHKLLSAEDTVACTASWRKSLFTGGLFQLNISGQLHVTSTYPEFIKKSEHHVFFGAELLPDR